MYTIGIDLGGTNVAVGICNEDYVLLDKISRPTVNTSADEIVRQMADITLEIIKKNNLKKEEILWVGITAPGTVTVTGVVEYAPNLPLVNYDIAGAFRKSAGIERVYVANDANAAALGEFVAGAGKEADSLVMLTLGTGVGGGVILGGKIFAGGINTSGTELGHTVIVKGGRLCGCGRRGCLETYASATGLKLSTKEKIDECRAKGRRTLMMGKPVNARSAFDAAKMGDEAAIEVINDYIYSLACGATNMINIFQPEVLLIGGGISGEGDNLLIPLRKIIDSEEYTRRNEKRTKILIASLGNDAGIIGAAALGGSI